ncbi:MAG: hypothetical protein KKG04_03535 [Candidatus Thermoplasmatota archaeon]|nr:hypothetical protein [Candidatus Thermoplasmatota archaeon]
MDLNPNCSEAVFRFHTVEPEQMQYILQAIADEVCANNDFWEKQTVPKYKTAKEYDTSYGGKPSYSWDSLWKEDGRSWEQKRDEAQLKSYPKGSLLYACAGLGDNQAVVRVNDSNFTLNIGNNDIVPNKTGWIEKILNLEIRVDEAETDESLQRIARDCTCGIEFFNNEKCE